LVILFAFQIALVISDDSIDEESTDRKAKVLPIFQVVRFPNDLCTGSSYNGTCYTAEECSNLGGTKDGSCASGFGVCCYFQMSCNSTSSQNYTYLYQAAATSVNSPCTYTVCPCSTSICRIRYDFSTLTLAIPTTLTAVNTAELASNPYGQCLTDAFSITAPGSASSPQICGTNSGYHMILDNDGQSCQVANFLIGDSTTTTRSWNIRVTQYTCGQEDEAGPPGCLQYLTETQNYIQNYGWPTGWSSTTTTSPGYQHLSNQYYDICVRRESGYCHICYSPINPATAGTITFGLSAAIGAPMYVGIDTVCRTDYIEIPFGTTSGIAAKAGTAQAAFIASTTAGRHCGVRFGVDAGTPVVVTTVCSKSVPFRVGVHFNHYEDGAPATAVTSELHTATTGTVGFKLLYWQVSC